MVCVLEDILYNCTFSQNDNYFPLQASHPAPRTVSRLRVIDWVGHAGRSLLFKLKALSDIENEKVKNIPYYTILLFILIEGIFLSSVDNLPLYFLVIASFPITKPSTELSLPRHRVPSCSPGTGGWPGTRVAVRASGVYICPIRPVTGGAWRCMDSRCLRGDTKSQTDHWCHPESTPLWNKISQSW